MKNLVVIFRNSLHPRKFNTRFAWWFFHLFLWESKIETGKMKWQHKLVLFIFAKTKAHQHKTYSTWGLKQWSLAGSCPKFRCILSGRWMVKDKTQCWNLSQKRRCFNYFQLSFCRTKAFVQKEMVPATNRKPQTPGGTICSTFPTPKMFTFWRPKLGGNNPKDSGCPNFVLWRYTHSTIRLFIPEAHTFRDSLKPILWPSSEYVLKKSPLSSEYTYKPGN